MRDRKPLFALLAIVALATLASCLFVPIPITGPVTIYNPSDEPVVITSDYFADPNLKVTIPARGSARVQFAPTSGYVDLYLDGKCYFYDVRVMLSSYIDLIPDAYWLPIKNSTKYTLSLIRFIPAYGGPTESAIFDSNGKRRDTNTTIYSGDTVAFKLSEPTSLNTRGYIQIFTADGQTIVLSAPVWTGKPGGSSSGYTIYSYSYSDGVYLR